MRRVAQLFRLLIIILLLGGAAFIGGFAWFTMPGPPAPAGAETIVQLERGMSLMTIADRLQAAGIVPNAQFFAVAVTLTGAGNELKAGEYAVPSHASMAEVLSIIQQGKSILHKLTVPEGFTSAQALRLINDNDVLVGNIAEAPAEGTLLPETYLFPRGTARAELIGDMRAAHDRLLNDLWPKRAPELPFDTKQEAVTLASIVEKETAKPEERARIAAVFINRLKRSMMLQSDPTVIYGLTGGEPMGRGLKQSELNKETPYNTYVIAGLPPTPIANPGAASLEAVLNPVESKELYFVADGSGGHVFATTLSEHQANVRKWRRIEREFNNGLRAQ